MKSRWPRSLARLAAASLAVLAGCGSEGATTTGPEPPDGTGGAPPTSCEALDDRAACCAETDCLWAGVHGCREEALLCSFDDCKGNAFSRGCPLGTNCILRQSTLDDCDGLDDCPALRGYCEPTAPLYPEAPEER